MATFFSNEAVSLEKQVDVDNNDEPSEWYDSDRQEDINDCIEWILKNDFKRVCLQFPDHLLQYSTEIATNMNRELQNHVFVMADTTYESCCVDYITAAHVNADAIVHFGSKCFSDSTDVLPCYYISPRCPLEVDELYEILGKELPGENHKILMLDSPFAYKKAEISNCEQFKSGKYRLWTIFDKHTLPEDVHVNEHCNVVFIGYNERKLMHFYFLCKLSSLYYYHPKKNQKQLKLYKPSNRIISRRNYLIEKVKDSKTIGILVSTLAVKNYIKVIERIKNLATLNNKKYYVIYVGKPTVAKLANFQEIDVYVVITCPMSEIFESRDFYQPIVTPYDVEMALNAHNIKDSSFDPTCTVFINEKLTEGELKSEGDVSLITGQVRYKEESHKENASYDDSSQIACRSEGALVAGTHFGAGFLSQRTWKGLEQNLGQTDVTLAEEGTRGVAKHYENEGS